MIHIPVANALMMVGGGIFSLFICIFSALALPWLICRLPEDYFLRLSRSTDENDGRHNGISSLIRCVLVQLTGYILILAGLIMLFTPGQGVLTLVCGLSLVEFPGKRRVLIRIVTVEKIQQAMNWIRNRCRVTALKFP